MTDYERISSLLDAEMDDFERTDRCVMFWLLVAAVLASALVALTLGFE